MPACEVELHEAPLAPVEPHRCLQQLEPDSEGDSEDEKDPDDGSGTFLDYLRRRLLAQQVRVRQIDCRELGDDDHPELRQAFQALATAVERPETVGVDLEDLAPRNARQARRAERPTAIPSWEAL